MGFSIGYREGVRDDMGVSDLSNKADGSAVYQNWKYRK